MTDQAISNDFKRVPCTFAANGGPVLRAHLRVLAKLVGIDGSDPRSVHELSGAWSRQASRRNATGAGKDWTPSTPTKFGLKPRFFRRRQDCRFNRWTAEALPICECSVRDSLGLYAPKRSLSLHPKCIGVHAAGDGQSFANGVEKTRTPAEGVSAGVLRSYSVIQAFQTKRRTPSGLRRAGSPRPRQP